jgi:hypothetical protein
MGWIGLDRVVKQATAETSNQGSGVGLLVMHAISRCNLTKNRPEMAPSHWSTARSATEARRLETCPVWLM